MTVRPRPFFLPVPGILLIACSCATNRPAIERPPPAPLASISTWERTPEAVNDECRRRVQQAQTSIRQRLDDADPAVSPVDRLAEIEMQLANLADDLTVERFIGRVSDDRALREATQECEAAISTLRRDFMASPALLQLARAAHDSAPNDDALRKLASIYLEQGHLLGAHFDEDTRILLSAWYGELDRVQSAFQNTLFEKPATVRLTDQEMDGAPDALRAASRTHDGVWDVPASLQTFHAFMRNVAARDARQRYLRAYENIGGDINMIRIKRALRLRRNIAQTLGYASWSDLRTSTGMAETTARAQDLLIRVGDALLPKARAELAQLQTAQGPEPLQPWDYDYAQEQVNRQRSGLTGESARPFFPSSYVLPSMFKVFEDLLGLIITELPEAPAWAPAVTARAVQDAQTGETLGYIYLDLSPRPGKFLRPATFQIRVSRRLADGQRRRPISAIVGNGPAAVPGATTLFSHRDLIELFHELGHVMHMTVSTAPFATVGTHLRRDFVEAPSQMLEQWMWTPQVLRRMSRHVDTGVALSDDQIDALLKERTAWGGLFWTRQVFLAAFDLALHAPTDKAIAPNDLWFQLKSTYTPLEAISGTKPVASFLPIMGGYDAAYYGYVWSQVCARDMFTAFEKTDPLDRATGQRYRTLVLEPAGLLEPDQLLRNFLERAPTEAAFLQDLLAPATLGESRSK